MQYEEMKKMCIKYCLGIILKHFIGLKGDVE
jgi:hypothetical protein